jgi:hypothetical protein
MGPNIKRPLICGIGEMLGLVVPSIASMSACVLVIVYASLRLGRCFGYMWALTFWIVDL